MLGQQRGLPHAFCSCRLDSSLNSGPGTCLLVAMCPWRASHSRCLAIHCSYRLENTLNYGMERVWAVGYVKGSNSVAVG